MAALYLTRSNSKKAFRDSLISLLQRRFPNWQTDPVLRCGWQDLAQMPSDRVSSAPL